MTINNIKELRAVIQLCQRSGVTAIKIDGIEMALNTYTTAKQKTVYANMDFPEANISVPQPNIPAQAVADKIATDELTAEQLMFYSSAGQEQ